MNSTIRWPQPRRQPLFSAPHCHTVRDHPIGQRRIRTITHRIIHLHLITETGPNTLQRRNFITRLDLCGASSSGMHPGGVLTASRRQNGTFQYSAAADSLRFSAKQYPVQPLRAPARMFRRIEIAPWAVAVHRRAHIQPQHATHLVVEHFHRHFAAAKQLLPWRQPYSTHHKACWCPSRCPRRSEPPCRVS